jgi:hypothetical protein
MSHFRSTYVEPGNRLSLERAREHDRVTALQEGKKSGSAVVVGGGDRSAAASSPFLPDAGVEARRRKFDRSAYRQPVLTELAAEPWTYRRGVDDPETLAVRHQLRQVNRYATMELRKASIGQVSSSTESRLDLFSP